MDPKLPGRVYHLLILVLFVRSLLEDHVTQVLGVTPHHELALVLVHREPGQIHRAAEGDFRRSGMQNGSVAGDPKPFDL